MKKMLKPLLFILIGVVASPFLLPIIAKIPVVGPMIAGIGQKNSGPIE